MSLQPNKPPPQVPFVGLDVQARRLRAGVERRLHEILDHGRYVMGPEVTALERALAERVGAPAALVVSSGTDALLMPLMAEGVGPGDAVFVPSFTFTATAEVPLLCGAEPVFVDVDQRTYNLCAESLAEQIERVKTEGRLRPRALLAVDLFGLPADYAGLAPLCEREGVLVIADAAQSFGGAAGSEQEQAVGRLAPYTATSFYPAKPLGGYGDGGAILCESTEDAEVLASIRQHGYGELRYQIVRVGINGRLDSFQAAVLLEKLTVFDEEMESRDRLAQAYTKAFTERLDGAITCPSHPDGVRCAWAQYTVQIAGRDAVRERLSELGVPSVVYYPLPMHLQPAYRAYGQGNGSLPVSEELCERVLSLPMNPYQTPAHTEQVIEALAAVVPAVD